ncbi:bdp1, partial [Symbiodinium microadriaticum]
AFLPSLGLPLGDQEEGMKPSQALGPQLCLDESGNIVLNQSSLSQNLTSMDDPLAEGAGGVQEAVSQYTSAYKKTPACRWTDHETQMFYEALSLYGTDLFLVQTFFRNKSAGQIKTKYSKELKKHPDKVQE